MMPTAPTLRERLRGQQVRLPEETQPTGDFIGISTMRKLAGQKGFEARLVPKTEGGSSVRLVGDGGVTHDFDTIREAAGFVMTKKDQAVSPVELQAGETSAFEAAVQGEKLNKEQILNLGKQRTLMQNQPPLENLTSEL